MQDIISSLKNDKVKYLRKLYNSQKRKREGKYILEGLRLVEEAIKAGAMFKMIFMTPEFESSIQGQVFRKNLSDVDIYYIDSNLVEKLADTVSPQGIIAIVDEPTYNNNNFLKNTDYILVLDRIQDPGNMGALIRTAVAAGVDRVIALKGCVDIYNLKVLRATAGAIFRLPIMSKVESGDLKDIKEKDNFKLISTDISGDNYYHQLNYEFPLMLVIGNEANGVQSDILDISDYKVKIPLIGEIESLNAAVAGGIILYQIAICH